MKLAKEEDIENIITKLNPKKSSGLDNIPVKIVKQCAHIIKRPLTSIIKATIKSSTFVDKAKSCRITNI